MYFFFETSFVVLMLVRPRVQQRAQAERFAASSENTFCKIQTEPRFNKWF
jgi:hypothetical protein